MNETVHSIFPILIFEDYYEDNENFLKIIHETWQDHYTDGHTNELTGNFDLQLDERYADLYAYLTKSVKKFLATSGVVYENFDINFVKSWFNSLESISTPLHDHADAHISVVYYASTPETAKQKIRFHCVDKTREPFIGIYDCNSYEYNQFNGKTYQLDTKMGQIFVFPSKLAHDTVHPNEKMGMEPKVYDVEDLKRKRICIASDVVLTYNSKQTKPSGIQPVFNWRTFNE